jgi:ABC-2 type transport system ATP-binding protein
MRSQPIITAAPPPLPRAPARPLLEVRGAHAAYGSRKVLRGLDLKLSAAEVLVLLGPNGAGKSTLIKAMSGRLTLDSGSISICGLDPASNPAASRLCGIVPQNIALFEKLTAQENLETFGRLMGLPGRNIAKAALATLGRVGLSPRARDRVGSLSGGMRRRINIAAAMMHQPKILVLDEPTVGLDYEARAGLAQLLRDLRQSGLAILLTTHDMDEAEALADRVAVLVGGVVKAEGAPRELIARLFDGRRQLTVALNPDAARRHPDIAAALSAAGLVRRPDSAVWSGIVVGNDQAFDGIVKSALAAGGVIEEVRVRQPDLTTLLAAFVTEARQGAF